MKIIHRQTGSTGSLFGVQFTNGIGHTTDRRVIERLRRQGHTVLPDDADNLTDLTVAQLREHAERNGIDLAGARTKADILAAIGNG